MAVKWAIANGNWNAGATWNDGAEPTTGDVVYLDAHNVTMNVTTIQVKEIRQDTNPNTSLSGGVLLVKTAGNRYIIADTIYVNSEDGIVGSGNNVASVVTITANEINVATNSALCSNSWGNGGFIVVVNCNTINMNLGSYLIKSTTTGGTRTLQINGNIISDGVYITNQYVTTNLITITGIINNVQFDQSNTTTCTCCVMTINGSVSFANSSKNFFIGVNSSIDVVGELNVKNNGLINCTTITLNGNLAYENGFPAIYSPNLTIQNTSTFRWIDKTSPRTNPFIIVTNYEINNTTNYPAESDVKKDVPYAYGQKVGTYQPDYPQQSTVLDGVEYDNGNLTGTMQVSNLPQTTLDRLANCVTVDILDAQLNAKL